MAKTRKYSRSTSKSTSVKVSNKNYNRQVKAGKIKPKNSRLFKPTNVSAPKAKNRGKRTLNNVSSLPTEDQLQENTFSQFSAYKRKLDVEDDEENVMHYEQVPRNSFTQKKMKHLLPLKDSSGLIPQVVEVPENTFNFEEERSDYSESELELQPVAENTIEHLSIVELCGTREKKLAEIKQKIAVWCSSVVENPEENLRMLKEVLHLLDINDPDVYLTVRKLACLSLVEVFKDILPSYKIRSATTKEHGQKLKKETRQLRDYEESLLKYYKQFLSKLEKMLECLKSKYKDNSDKFSEAKVRAKRITAALAIKCFSELLLAHPSFNFSTNILKVVVEKIAVKDSEVSKICCDTVKNYFKCDKVGEASLECVKLIKKLVKSRNYNIPVHVLQTFLFLNVKEADVASVNSKDKHSKKKQMSKKEKKQQKKMQVLEKELRETEAVESRSKKSKFHTSILNEVFLIYFSVLKGDYSLSLLAPVLEGLSKFSHLINIDYFDDLVKVMYKILESNKLEYRETLHCLKSVFTILSGQGEALNIDPQGFYTYLYRCVQEVNVKLSDDDITLLLQCIDLMIIQRRKKVTTRRVFAFLKSLSTISLFQSSHVTLSLLTVIRQLFLNFKQCDILLDTENSGSGQYSPDLEDPEYCNAGSTALWELCHLSRSYHPVIAKYANHLLLCCPNQGQGQLHPFMALKTPSQILHQFMEERTLLSSLLQPKGNQFSNNHAKKFHPCVTDDNSITSLALTSVRK